MRTTGRTVLIPVPPGSPRVSNVIGLDDRPGLLLRDCREQSNCSRSSVRGIDLPLKLIERLIEQSHAKYCTVSNMLKHTAEITWDARLDG